MLHAIEDFPPPPLPLDTSDVVCGFRVSPAQQQQQQQRQRHQNCRVSFDPRVTTVTAEEGNLTVTSAPLCESGKDTRSKLVPMSHEQKCQLYLFREDLRPPNFDYPSIVKEPEVESPKPAPELKVSVVTLEWEQLTQHTPPPGPRARDNISSRRLVRRESYHDSECGFCVSRRRDSLDLTFLENAMKDSLEITNLGLPHSESCSAAVCA